MRRGKGQGAHKGRPYGVGGGTMVVPNPPYSPPATQGDWATACCSPLRHVLPQLRLAGRAPIRYPTGCCTFHYSNCLEGPPLQRGGQTGEVRCKTGAVPQL